MRTLLAAGLVLAAALALVPDASATGSPCDENQRDLVTGVSYDVDGTAHATLAGNVHQGATVTVTFSIAEGCDAIYSLVSYEADADFDLESQALFESDTVTIQAAAGTHTLTVAVPDCHFQVDFVAGMPIEQFDPPAVTYSAQSRLIAAATGGDMACLPSSPPQPTYACPTNLTGQESPQGSMSIDWDWAQGATGYRVYMAVGDGELAMVHEGDATLGGYGIAPVEAGVVYTFMVTALYGDVESQGCETLEMTGIPEFPTGVAVVAAGVLGTAAYAVMRRRKA